MRVETRAPQAAADLREAVRERYATAARAVDAGARADCCGEGPGSFGSGLYGADVDDLPAATRVASLGCGDPVAVAELHPGETVLDLGSGGGLDVILSARRVGPAGRAYGLDMTEEMLDLAQRNAAVAGTTNAIFLRGLIESIPLPAASIDVIVSNCVVNLSTEKPLVMAEMARVLRAGGRIGISDVVADDTLTAAQRAERGSFVGCIAGALSFDEYEASLVAAGFTDVSVTPTHAVADGLYGATVRAVRGEGGRMVSPGREAAELPVVATGATGCGCDCDCGCAATGGCRPGPGCC